MSKKWTEHEVATLHDMWGSGLTIKSQAHRLPGRSLIAIKQAIRTHRLGRKKRGEVSWVWPAIVRELKMHPDLTIREISERIGCCYRHARDLMHAKHVLRVVHISGWKRQSSNQIEKWAAGNAPDTPKPGLQTREERQRLDRIRYRTKVSKVKPFQTMLAQLGAASTVPSLTGSTGRVYQQSMSVKDDEMEIVA